MQGDPINLFMKAMIQVQDGLITPKQYKGVMTMLIMQFKEVDIKH